ncbi:MAG: LPS assembly lipoprotein LptE [Pseudomonadota bacterium]
MAVVFPRLLGIAAVLALTACQFQPLHGNSSALSQSGGLQNVSVSQVDSRVAQQVRNHLLFLLNGGNGTAEKSHEARIRVSWDNKLLAALPNVQDATSGSVTVTVSYDLVDLSTGTAVASGTRKATASYDRTGQVFANERAERDAENRAAREAAESLRLAIASDMNRA